MLTQHIALVPEEDGLNPSELARVSAALQKQVTRDLLPLWSLAATVDAFPALEDVPVGYWPIILTRCELGNHGRVHIDRSGQPYAQVQLRPLWSLAASRACLEMLVNPYETRSVSAPSLRSDQGPVDFLVEVCAPCEDPRNAYVIDGILVSDFCTPAFFGARSGQAERHTARGMLIPALHPQPGGHMTWYDAISDSFWLRNHWADNPIDTKLGAVDRKIVSVRELVHACTPMRPMPDLHARGELEGSANQARASQRRAQQLRALLGKRLDQEFDAAFDAVRMDLPPVTPRAAEARAKPAAEVRPHAIEIEPGEFEDIDTFVQLLDELPEQMELLEEIAVPVAAPVPFPVAAPIPVPVPAPIPIPIPVAAPVPAPAPAPVAAPVQAPRVARPPLGLRPDDEGRPQSSIAPVTLGTLDEKSDARPKAPLVGALAAAAVVALVWTVAATQTGSRTSKSSAQAPRSAATSPVAPVAAPAPPPPVPLPTAPEPAATAAAATPAKVATPIKPKMPAVAGPKLATVRPALATAAKVKPPYDVPLPPREAPKMADEAPVTASIDDLIEDRR